MTATGGAAVTARALVLAHPDDRAEVAARFGLAPDDLDGRRGVAVQLSDVPPAAADTLVAAARTGGVLAAAAGEPTGRAGLVDVLLVGDPRVLAPVPASVAPLVETWRTALARRASPAPALTARGRRLRLDGRALVVGILNATPDSFYDQGRYFGLDRGLARADAMLEEGADLIEVGGETARPSVAPVTEAEEIRRTQPLLRALARRVDVPLVIDTYKPAVARAALDAGAAIVNDISGLADERLATAAAAAGAALVITHIRRRPKVADARAQYRRVADEVYAFLARRLAQAEALGVRPDALVVDPGFSFGKQPAHDVTLLRRLAELHGLGRPIYLAASRKNFIRDLLGLPVPELLEGTLAVVACGVLAGARLVRTHDVRATRRVVEMVHAVLGPTPPTTGGGASTPAPNDPAATPGHAEA